MDAVKICVVGAEGSGKSQFIHKFCAFTAAATPRGQEDVWNKKFKIGSKTRMAEFFDSYGPTAQRREFIESMSKDDYIFVLYNGTSTASLLQALNDAEDVMQYAKGPKWLLLCNNWFGKQVLDNSREVMKFQQRINADYLVVDVQNKVGYPQVQKYLFQ
ncbi:Ras family domain-containing protein [Spironucleus salmonicida]|uniref:Ras family domain-containing protein n=1 Tax=Spironucleus salmonicida TaxID=348837 RepID=V6LAG9_9EUKA|nr:Ras family domain-containing protein [Spironucleus salmonicida]|eukprot:EST41407.1 Ras family domain-containing protein [Spironucleus salmonicida]